jgi:putative hydrolase of the HAD superfamily
MPTDTATLPRTVDAVGAVLFDLDGTLCRYRRSPGEVLAVAFEREGLDPLFPVEAYYEAFDRFAADADGMTDLRERCFAALCADRGHDPAVGRSLARTFADERDHRDVVATPGAHATLDALDGTVPLGVVTNGPRDAQHAKLDGLGRHDAFEVVVCAGDETPPKPATEPFEAALDALAVAPERTLFVGDSPSTDVAGANATGLVSVLVGERAAEAPRPDALVASLHDVTDLVGGRPP